MQINDKLMKNYVKQPVILYEGNTLGDITLNDSVANYQYIEILYHDNNDIFNSVKIENANGKLVQFYGGIFARPHFYQRNGMATINGNAITFKSIITIDFVYNNYPQITENNNEVFTITKVLGYK